MNFDNFVNVFVMLCCALAIGFMPPEIGFVTVKIGVMILGFVAGIHFLLLVNRLYKR